jgi:hypothetical protein
MEIADALYGVSMRQDGGPPSSDSACASAKRPSRRSGIRAVEPMPVAATVDG